MDKSLKGGQKSQQHKYQQSNPPNLGLGLMDKAQLHNANKSIHSLKHDRNVSDSSSIKLSSQMQDLQYTDLHFFEQMILKFQEELQRPLMQRRQDMHKEDPVEELKDLYGEMKEQEKNFKKILEISSFMIEKNKELFNQNDFLGQEFEQMVRQLQLVQDQNTALMEDNKRQGDQSQLMQNYIKDLEKMNACLKDEIDEKNQMLDEYEKNLNESRNSERASTAHQSLISPQDLAALKSTLGEKIKRVKELEQILTDQTVKYDMEVKKSNQLMNEIRKLRETQKELNDQIDEFNAVLDEKDLELEEYERQIVDLKDEINRQNVQKKQSSFQMTTGGVLAPMVNPLAPTQMTANSIQMNIVREKKKSINQNLMQQQQVEMSLGVRENKQSVASQQQQQQYKVIQMNQQPKKNSEIIKNILNNPSELSDPEKAQERAIKVSAQIEDFRPQNHQRKVSCPLVITDSTGLKFKIYDKDFTHRVEQAAPQQPNPVQIRALELQIAESSKAGKDGSSYRQERLIGESKRDWQSIDKQEFQGVKKMKKASDDKRVAAPPPEYYPFNELEQEVEEAQLKLRLPSSLRFQTDYIAQYQQIGQQLQENLNGSTKQQDLGDQGIDEDNRGVKEGEGALLLQESQDGASQSQDNDSEQQDALAQLMDSKMLEGEHLGNHATFRPVSILDRGLDINEDEFNYDALNRQSMYRDSMYQQQNFQGQPEPYTGNNSLAYLNESFAEGRGTLRGEGFGTQFESPDDVLGFGRQGGADGFLGEDSLVRESMYVKKGKGKNNPSLFAKGISTIKKEGDPNLYSLNATETETKMMETIQELQQEERNEPKREDQGQKEESRLRLDIPNESFEQRSSERQSQAVPINTPSFQQQKNFKDKNENFQTFAEGPADQLRLTSAQMIAQRLLNQQDLHNSGDELALRSSKKMTTATLQRIAAAQALEESKQSFLRQSIQIQSILSQSRDSNQEPLRGTSSFQQPNESIRGDPAGETVGESEVPIYTITTEEVEEKKKTSSHQKKITDSTAIEGSKSTAPVVLDDVPFAINVSREHIPFQSINSQLGREAASSFQPMHPHSQILSTEQLADPHHIRGYSNIPKPKDKEGSTSQENKSGGPGGKDEVGSGGGAAGGPHSNSSSYNRSPTQNSLNRKDPNEEFFMMTLLTYKLNHKEYEKILTMDGRDLYLEAVALKKPFFEWPRWIENKLDGIYLDLLYRKKKAQKGPQFGEQKSQKLGELNIKLNYF